MSDNKNRLKASFESRKFKSGAYSTIVTIVVIAIVLVINLLVGELNLKIDLSKEGIFTLSEQTKGIVSNLNDKVTIYQIARSGSDEKTFTEVIDKYKALSSNISVIQKDPILYPTFTSKYLGPNETLEDNSLIVECGERFKTIPFSQMILEEFNYGTYSNDIVGIDVEGKLTEAILYVTSLELPIMYEIEGHSEIPLPTQVRDNIQKDNVEIQSLNLLTAKTGVPEDASCILINAPQFDYSEEEITQLMDYLAKGGRAIILTGYTTSKLANFESLLLYYGIELADGIVLEGNTSYYSSGGPAYLIPKVNVHDITKPIKSNNLGVIAIFSKGLMQLPTVRNSLNITSLLNTSSDAYSVVNVDASTYDKSEGDIDGPFDIAVAIEEEYSGAKTKLVVYGTYEFINEQVIIQSAIGNSDMFLNSINWLVEQKSNISIRTRSITTESLTLTSTQIGILAISTVIVIPAIFLVTGIVVWLRRRKK